MFGFLTKNGTLSLLKTTLLLGALLIASMGCSSSENPREANQSDVLVQKSQTRLLVNGDPLTFIAGTRKDQTSGLPMELFADESQWHHISFQMETARQQRLRGELKDIPVKDARHVLKKVMYFRLNKVGENLYDLSPTNSRFYSFSFKKEGKKLIFLGQKHEDGSLRRLPRFQVQHYSVKNDGSAFSLLFSYQNRREKYLVNAIFIRKLNQSPFSQMVSQLYNYLWGPGVAVRWKANEPVAPIICGGGTMDQYANIYEEAIEEWAQHLKGRLKLFSSVQETPCPPFSDLNTQTISHVREWIDIVGEPGTTGANYSIPNIFNSTFVDSDIFVMESELNQMIAPRRVDEKEAYDDPQVRQRYWRTALHELGHFLGLQHVGPKFDLPEHFQNQESIMSYQKIFDLTDYDKKAVQELYPPQ